jgi:hypothetical protein
MRQVRINRLETVRDQVIYRVEFWQRDTGGLPGVWSQDGTAWPVHPADIMVITNDWVLHGKRPQ